jgi:carboxymethylenebutenolidase
MQALSPNLTTTADRNLTFQLEKGDPAQAYLSPINNEAKVGLVLIQEWWGLNKSIMTTADKFAVEGFKVLCPDMYRGKVAKDTENAGHLLTGLDWKDALGKFQL